MRVRQEGWERVDAHGLNDERWFYQRRWQGPEAIVTHSRSGWAVHFMDAYKTFVISLRSSRDEVQKYVEENTAAMDAARKLGARFIPETL